MRPRNPLDQFLWFLAALHANAEDDPAGPAGRDWALFQVFLILSVLYPLLGLLHGFWPLFAPLLGLG